MCFLFVSHVYVFFSSACVRLKCFNLRPSVCRTSEQNMQRIRRTLCFNLFVIQLACVIDLCKWALITVRSRLSVFHFVFQSSLHSFIRHRTFKLSHFLLYFVLFVISVIRTVYEYCVCAGMRVCVLTTGAGTATTYC